MNLFKVSIIFTISFLLLIKELNADNIEELKLCENTIESIETQTDIPKGLLLGIGKAEAIRKIKNKFVIWPWTLNHNGKSMFFDTKKQMRNYVFKNLKRNDFNIDVGCMQINIKWHKNNFKKISDMFEVNPNISYAASFLQQLKNKYGSWDKAIKHYHSSDPKKNKPYLIKVKSFWKKVEEDKIIKAKNIKYKSFKKINETSLANMIRKRQPYLFERIEKVEFFRNIFSQN